MKLLSGKVMSSNPISLSKAAKIMSGFASVDNGATDVVRIYIRRTSDAFHSLGLLHKELKNPLSHHMLNGSQPIDSEVNTETLADILENPEEKKVKKHKKKHNMEASQLVTVKTEEKEDLNHEFGSNNKDAVVTIDQGPHGVSGKKRKKTDKTERKQNEEHLNIAQVSNGAAEVQALKVLDDRVKKEKAEYMSIKNEHDGSGEVSVKREKKRKRIEGKDQGKSSEVVDVKKENIMDAADGLESAGVGKQDGKNKRKKMKTEGTD